MIANYRNFLLLVFRKPDAARAAFILSIPVTLLMLGGLTLLGYMLLLSQDTPSLREIENPEWSYASVAYTADGVELARYGRQNRTWIPYDSISIHTRNALIATEDHRFYDHWGVNLFRMTSAASQTILGKLGLPFDRQGGSTLTQQLARNIYNKQIGFEVSIERKLKEAVTAVRLEQLYAKDEIAEMYLNTVSFLYNAYGIEAAARTYFDKSASDLDLLESATLVGLLKGPYRYDPQRNPERSKIRRNTVMQRMISQGWLDKETYEAVKDIPTETKLRTADVTQSVAPYFAEQVRRWVTKWGQENNIDIYGTALRIETTLDSRLQSAAQDAVSTTLDGLQAVVNCEWSARSSPRLQFGADISKYQNDPCHTDPNNHWAWFWERNSTLLNSYIRESARYRSLRNDGKSDEDTFDELLNNSTFIDSLKTAKSRVENGFVAMDPSNGHVKAWVGGRDLSIDWYDHVGVAKRQPGSIFKPFTYAWAVDSDYSPESVYIDSVFQYKDEVTGTIWSPQNFGDISSGEQMTMREGLARSLNTVTAQIIHDINPRNVADFANLMGIKSDLDPVPSLALGTSDVTLLEAVNAYSTFANRGIQTDPVMVTRIVSETGQILYQYQPKQKEVLSEETASVVIDMLRDVINMSYGTGIRIRNGYGLYGYDFAGKTGTTQRGADGWFILMHPELVTGAWVGFNDRRMSFRSSYWGQGAHNALFVVGGFLADLKEDENLMISIDQTFPPPPYSNRTNLNTDPENRVKW
ncbi:MAG: transglycosylase domain-containing protein [Bacteroidetes bacterium]|nr:transglycosylase domain-containing protein [Bacteroidota bacterium]MCY4204808.1 transglycosylase domain-containing protein [Bacteroidota bacterium]